MRLTKPETAVLQRVCGYAWQSAEDPDVVAICAEDAHHLLHTIGWVPWQDPALKRQCADACRQIIAGAERPVGTPMPDFGPLRDTLWATARRLGFDDRWVQEVTEEMPNP